MKKFLMAAFLGLLTAGGAVFPLLAQTGYPVAGSGLRIYPTPSMPHPRLPYTHKKPMPKKASTTQKFYDLYPAPKATPLRTQKLKPLMGIVPGQFSRQAHTTQSPPKPIMPPNPKSLAPNNGMVSVLGPRQINYPTLYRNPTPVYP